jgi:hypothetical protein
MEWKEQSRIRMKMGEDQDQDISNNNDIAVPHSLPSPDS